MVCEGDCEVCVRGEVVRWCVRRCVGGEVVGGV